MPCTLPGSGAAAAAAPWRWRWRSAAAARRTGLVKSKAGAASCLGAGSPTQAVHTAPASGPGMGAILRLGCRLVECAQRNLVFRLRNLR